MIRLLLVEDNRADARLLEEYLRGERFALTKAETLQAGIAVVADHDVVLLDLSLPDAVGLETLTRMLDASRTVPIIVLTGTRDDRIALEAVAVGAQDYLLKDELTPELVVRTIRYAIERKKLQTLEVERAKTSEALAHARFIADVTAAASSSLDVDESMRRVARLLVPALADFCAIDVRQPNGKLKRVAGHAANADHLSVLHEISERFAATSTYLTAAVQRAIDARDSVLIEQLDLAGVEDDGRYRALALALQMRSMLVMPLVVRGEVIAVVICATGPARPRLGEDDRMRLQEVAGRVALAIENARLFTEAQRALRGRDELLAIVSHDLRNPLGVVDLALEMIERDAKSLATALPRAQRAVERMTTLISDLLELSRIDAGTLTVEPQPTPLAELLQDVIEQHRALCANKGISLVGDVPPDLGVLPVDKNRLAQALGNLLGNAIKFTPANGSIVLAARRRASGVEVEVRDTGAGIPSDHLPHVFERFWQANRKSKDGVGLGLAIVKGIIDAHGGLIDVASELGAGTTFKIELRA